MKQEIGVIAALYRYPVKSMAGENLETAELGWHGLQGDRRLAFRKVGDTNGFPWLTASKLPELLLFTPLQGIPLEQHEVSSGNKQTQHLPTHIRTPEGAVFELYSDMLREEVSRRCKMDVEVTHLKHGIFDESPISLISTATINALGTGMDTRRFRPNIVIETTTNLPFAEDEYVGKSLVFGEAAHVIGQGAGLNVALLDERCMMVNLDPDTAESNPGIMKTVVKMNNNCAGVYCNVIGTGTLSVGQKVYLVAS